MSRLVASKDSAQKMVKVHPLAGKCGEGPPLAPELWKWRAGNRLNDMYFTSPTGEKFRSRPELNIFLATLDNPPPADSFQWRVTEEFLANNQVAFWDAKTPKKQGGEESPKKQSREGSSRKKTGKRKEGTKDTPDKGRKKPKFEFPPSPQPAMQEKSPLPISRPFPDRSETAKVAGFLSTPTAKPRPKMKATKKDKFDRNWEDDQFFSRVLASKASWKWLYDSEAAGRFLAEAENLKEKSDSERADMRNILLHRSSDMNNISRYSNQVLRVFVQILRNVQPPSTMGKVELADLVVNWKCKKRHFWCLLETSRLAPPPQPGTLKVDGFAASKSDDRANIDASKTGSISAPEDRTNVENIGGNSAQGQSRARLEESDTTSNEELQLEVTLRDIQETVRNIEETELPPDQVGPSVDLNVTLPSALEDNSQRPMKRKAESAHPSDFEDIPVQNADMSERDVGPEGLGVTLRGHQCVLASQSMYNVQYKMSESVVILNRVPYNSQRAHSTTCQQEEQGVRLPSSIENKGSSSAAVCTGVEESLPTPQIPSIPLSYHFPRESPVCWCTVCSKDQAFCRGCMCCLCSIAIKPEEDWMAIRCNCKHLCHVKCALENNLAGVVQDLNLDGELSCPSCSRKVDLWPFFEKSFDRLCSTDPKSISTDLETHALLVLRLLKGTQNMKYGYLRKLVVELHDLTQKFSLQTLVRQVLLGVKEELREPIDPGSDASKVVEDAMEAVVRKRAEIEPLFSALGEAYRSVVYQTRELRAAQVSTDMSKRKEVEQLDIAEGKAFSSFVVQQLENRKNKAEEEFRKLVQFKSSSVKPDTPTLADIDSSMNRWLDAVRTQRRAVEAAETELHLLKSSHNHNGAM